MPPKKSRYADNLYTFADLLFISSTV